MNDHDRYTYETLGPDGIAGLSPEDTRTLLDILIVAQLRTDGRVTFISRARSDRILWLRRVYPEMELDRVWEWSASPLSADAIQQIASEYFPAHRVSDPGSLAGDAPEPEQSAYGAWEYRVRQWSAAARSTARRKPAYVDGVRIG